MLERLSIPDIWIMIMNNVYYLTIIGVVIVVILENRNVVKSLGWILVLVTLPIIGLILYFFLGQNLRRDKIISKKSIKQVELINGYYQTLKIRFSIVQIKLPSVWEYRRQLISLLYKNNHSLFTSDNEVEIYWDGKETLVQMCKAIDEARDYIHLQSYIFEKDDVIGQKVVDLLKRKAREGVEVRLLVDSVGGWGLNKRFHRQMKEAGVESYEFLKVVFPNFTRRINYRNHRKLLIVDGKKGFIGGVNVADRYYSGAAEIPGIWRDTHMMIIGSAVNGLQSAFIQDWYFASQQRIKDPRYFNIKEAVGARKIQVVSSAPDSDWIIIEQAYVKMICSAEKYIYIQSPYFLPTESVRTALKVAAISGVDVRMMIPHISDGKFTQLASHSYLKEMLEAGVRIFRYSGGFIHSKMIVSDDNLVSIGSVNMDFRSFESNFEITAMVYDSEVAQKCKKQFYIDENNSYEVTIGVWMLRPQVKRIPESFARLFSPLL